jgi:hypothetical protein
MDDNSPFLDRPERFDTPDVDDLLAVGAEEEAGIECSSVCFSVRRTSGR